jgi:hypothetical protein
VSSRTVRGSSPLSGIVQAACQSGRTLDTSVNFPVGLSCAVNRARDEGRRELIDSGRDKCQVLGDAQGCVKESNEAGRVRGGRRHSKARTSRPCQGSAGGHRAADA